MVDGMCTRYFRDQSLLHPSVTDQHLLLWYFEDWLKKYFFSTLQILEVSVTVFDITASLQEGFLDTIA
jgi:ribosome biogenesis protein MAK21